MNTAQDDKKFLQQTIALAAENVQTGRGGPFAALVVKDEQVIATGANFVTSNNDPTAHAEILAINEACQTLKNWRLDGATIYISLEPCQMCLGAIKNSRISRVVFAAKSAVEASQQALPSIETGLLEKESAEILQLFFRNVRRIKGDSGNKSGTDIF